MPNLSRIRERQYWDERNEQYVVPSLLAQEVEQELDTLRVQVRRLLAGFPVDKIITTDTTAPPYHECDPSNQAS